MLCLVVLLYEYHIIILKQLCLGNGLKRRVDGQISYGSADWLFISRLTNWQECSILLGMFQSHTPWNY